jgi:hypothetical protein
VIEIDYIEKCVEKRESDTVEGAAVLHSGYDSLIGAPRCRVVILSKCGWRSRDEGRLCPDTLPQLPAPQYPVIERCHRGKSRREVSGVALQRARLPYHDRRLCLA